MSTQIAKEKEPVWWNLQQLGWKQIPRHSDILQSRSKSNHYCTRSARVHGAGGKENEKVDFAWFRYLVWDWERKLRAKKGTLKQWCTVLNRVVYKSKLLCLRETHEKLYLKNCTYLIRWLTNCAHTISNLQVQQSPIYCSTFDKHYNRIAKSFLVENI